MHLQVFKVLCVSSEREKERDRIQKRKRQTYTFQGGWEESKKGGQRSFIPWEKKILLGSKKNQVMYLSW